jgi:vacuolar-type H+-ATPase subunit F/Vma7
MSIVMVGDKYLTIGFRLAGIDTIEATDSDTAAEKITELLVEGKYKIYFVTEKVALKLKKKREELLKIRRAHPVFVVVPDFEGSLKERINELYQLASQAMGVKLK